MDMASQDSIRRAAAEVESLISTLDILVNNAGCTYRLRQWTTEGIEMQFGVNHIGTYLLTKLLFPLLKAAAKQSPAGETRIVNLSSHGHMLSPFRFHDYNMENKELPLEEQPISPMPPAFAKAQKDGYLSTIAYSHSKTANILFTLYLQDHFRASGIMSYALHPGGTYSLLRLLIWLINNFISQALSAIWEESMKRTLQRQSRRRPNTGRTVTKVDQPAWLPP
jgi:NAD(P)-dependent dehydrogenase (short-subunit alcohol dehydrogenase family)